VFLELGLVFENVLAQVVHQRQLEFLELFAFDLVFEGQKLLGQGTLLIFSLFDNFLMFCLCQHYSCSLEKQTFDVFALDLLLTQFMALFGQLPSLISSYKLLNIIYHSRSNELNRLLFGYDDFLDLEPFELLFLLSKLFIINRVNLRNQHFTKSKDENNLVDQ
jgi:hypothetical protein